MSDIKDVIFGFYNTGHRTGISNDLKTARRLEDEKCLEIYGFKVYSQNDEDGIIEEIFNRIGTTNKTFVEFGVENGLECNSHYLLHKGWHGLWIDGGKEHVEEINEKFMPALKNGQLRCTLAFIDKDNINRLIADSGIVGEIDLLSVGIDGNDYYVWKAINIVNPRVVIVEYNAKFPPNHAWKMAYNAKHQWDKSDWQGASLKALELLGRELGYQLVGTNLNGVNAFFVRNDLAADHFIKPATAENLYNPARYMRYSSGHPAKYYLENQQPNLGLLNYHPDAYEDFKKRRMHIKVDPNVLQLTDKKIAATRLRELGMRYHPVNTHSVFYLPEVDTDVIQRYLFARDDYFEASMLQKIFFDFKCGLLSKLLNDDKSVVLDIGANIGNHTMFFVNELNVGKVVAFEPVEDTFNTLKTNVELNKVEDRVELHNCGLSSKAGTASIGSYDPTNIGATYLNEGEGSIKLVAIDDFNFKTVTLMKIDVEGMEPEVLAGARKTIERCRPFIMIESFDDKYPIVEEFFASIKDYHHQKNTIADYLYYPAEYDNYHDADIENYDIVIHVRSSQVDRLTQSLPFIEKYLWHDRIVLIGSADTIKALKKSIRTTKIDTIDENDLVPDLNIDIIKRSIENRGGDPSYVDWYFEQFMKVGYALNCSNERYLVWDADTIPLRSLYFTNRQHKLYFTPQEAHSLPYLSEAMLVDTEIMRDITERLGGVAFWRMILNAIDPSNLNLHGFSALEIYKKFVSDTRPDLYRERPIDLQRDGAALFNRNLTDDELRLLPYDAITFSNWTSR